MDIEQIAIKRLQTAAEMSIQYYQKPLMITYSGGKDSDVCVELAKRSNIDFEVVNSHTTADAPETVRHIRSKFKELELQGIKCTILYPYYKGKRTSMWDLIVQKLMPPTRLVRYCCAVLKETAGNNRAIVTGVRRAESTKRGGRGVYETITPAVKDRIILNNDNDDRRQLIERCQIKGEIVTNPIIDWQDRDVWDYLADCKVKANPLYQCGFNRVGCIGCPVVGKVRWHGFAKYPAYANMYKRAFAKMLTHREAQEKKTVWQSAEEVFAWWMEDKNITGQLKFEDLEESQ